jgi:hypothetical protein
MLEKRLGDLEDWQRNLLGKAESVMRNSYNPYSHFYVGAAVLTQGGKIYLGTFAENSSQGMTICAEPAAILAANTDGERMFRAIAVIGAGEELDDERRSPDDNQAHDNVGDHVLGILTLHHVVAAGHVRDSCKHEENRRNRCRDVFDEVVDLPHGLQDLVECCRVSA